MKSEVDCQAKPLPARTQRFEQILIGLGLILGVEFWLTMGRGNWGRNFQIGFSAAIFGIAAIPPIRRLLLHLIQALNRIVSKARIAFALLILVTSWLGLYRAAVHDHRDFKPRVEDEFSYQLAAQQLAIGRLWEPRHPAAESLENIHLITDRVYASRYWPGAAMAFVPSVWLHLPMWTAVLTWASIACALMYLTVADLIDDVTGVLAALMLSSLEVFRLASISLMSNVPTIALGLLLVWSWTRWRVRKTELWAVVMGAAAGWLALTRMQDLPCFAVPVFGAIIFELRRSSVRGWAATAGCGVIGLLPFAAVGIVSNHGVTGSWFTPPYVYYARLYEPRFGLSFSHGISLRTISDEMLPQKKVLAEQIEKSFRDHAEMSAGEWFAFRIEESLFTNLPQPLMYLLIPVGILGALRKRGGVLAASGLIWVILYAGHFWRFPFYNTSAMPGEIMLVLLGAEMVRGAWPSLRGYLTVVIYGVLVVLSLTNWPQLNRFTQMITMMWANDPALTDISARLDRLPKKPALVLFQYAKNSGIPFDPVYNSDVPWPDDSPVIRAHDRGYELNHKLFKYYSAIDPNKAVYRFYDSDKSIVYLGTVHGLAEK